MNDAAGACTLLSTLIGAAIVFLASSVLLPYFHFLPKAVTSAIVFHAAITLIDFHDIAFIVRMRSWRDCILLSITLLATIFLGIQYGVLFACLSSLIVVLKQSAMPRFALLGRVGTSRFKDVAHFPNAHRVDDVMLVRIDEPLHFANSAAMKDMLLRIERLGSMTAHPSEDAKLPAVSAVVFEMGHMADIDAW